MKIPRKIESIYDDLTPEYLVLKNTVDEILFAIAQKNEWFYRSRIKKVESFCQKLEIDSRYFSSKYEDLLGCEIIVDTRTDIQVVLDELKPLFTIETQRPKDIAGTNLEPDSFRFADLRLYLRKKNISGPEESIHKLKFELQVKTIFSYSWSKATHGLIYKAKDISWAKERVAYQVKAMIEQSEYAIANIESTKTDFFPTHSKFESLQRIANLLKDKWTTALLPSDLKRCAENVLKLAELFGIEAKSASDILEGAFTADFLEKHRNLSPFYASLVAFEPAARDAASRKKDGRNRNTLLLIEELNDYLPKQFLDDLNKNSYGYFVV